MPASKKKGYERGVIYVMLGKKIDVGVGIIYELLRLD
jgi:hypothetical protein